MRHHDGDAVERLGQLSFEEGPALAVQAAGNPPASAGARRLKRPPADADHLEIVHGVMCLIHHPGLLHRAEQREIGPECRGDDADRRAVRRGQVQVSRSSSADRMWRRAERWRRAFRCAAIDACEAVAIGLVVAEDHGDRRGEGLRRPSAGRGARL